MDYRYKKYQLIRPEEQILMNESSKDDGFFSHSHEFIELVYIFSGKGIHTINGNSYFISSGDLLLIRANESHSILPVSEDNNMLQWINCIFLSEFIDFDFNIFSPGFRFIGTFGYEMNLLFQCMMEEFSDKKTGYLDILRGYLSVVLYRLSRASNNTNMAEKYVSTKKQMMVKKALDYLKLHYKEKISLSDISSKLGISSAYLSRLFKEFVNTSITEYINNYRLEQSCKLLNNPNLTINQIAIEVGFCDIKFYYRFFQKHMGTTPGEFRKKQFDLAAL